MKSTYTLKPSCQVSPALRREGARMLNDQWPEMGYAVRLRQLRKACSYLLIVDYFNTAEPQVLGHINIVPCPAMGNTIEHPEGISARACTFTTLLIAPSRRGRGLGLELLKLAEKQALQTGFSYVYVWCDEALRALYERGGYRPCARLAHRPCLALLSNDQRNTLEALVAKNAAQSGRPIKVEPLWFRKRLVKAVPPVHKTKSALRSALRQTLTTLAPQGRWQVFSHLVPWQAQIGPSCGLVALGMAAAYFNKKVDGADLVAQLLDKAVAAGYSRDGEIFDLDHLAALAREPFCGLHATISPCADPSLIEALHPSSGKLVVVPYDRDGNGQPCLRNGLAAHYGLIFGLARQHPPDRHATASSSGCSCLFLGGDLAEEKNPEQDNKGSWNEETVVLFWEGLSSRPIAAPWRAVRDSNAQLTQASDVAPGSRVMPLSGPRLAGRCLVLAG